MAGEPCPYRLELAKSDRSTCTVSKEKIAFGDVRFGSLLKVGGKGSYKWRKLGCITAKQAANVDESLGGPDKIDGFGDLAPEEQALVLDAFKAAASGHGAASVAAAVTAASAAATSMASSDGGAAAPVVAAAAPAAKKKAKAKAAPAGTPPAKKAKAGAGGASASAAVAVASAAAPAGLGVPLAPPPLTPEVIAQAHGVIDLAKNGKWKELFDRLGEGPAGLVNIRPEVREFSALHQAAYFGNLEAVNTLLDKFGADASQLTKFGKSVRAVAKEQGHWKVVEALELRDASATTEVLTPEKTKEKSAGVTTGGFVPVPDLTPAILGAAHGLIDLAKGGRWTEVFKVLDDRRELVNVRPEVREFGVLHQAAFLGDRDACSTLLEHYGADPSLLSREGATAAEIAEAEGHREVYKVLGSFDAATSAAGGGGGVAEGDDDDTKLIQQPDGSWKIVYVGAGSGDAQATSAGASGSSASSGDVVMAAASDDALVGMPACVGSTVPAAAAVVEPARSAVSAVAGTPPPPALPPVTPPPPTVVPPTATACHGDARAGSAGGSASVAAALVDTRFSEAGEWCVCDHLGISWSCELKQGGRVGVMQMLERDDGQFRVWSCLGPTGKPGTQEVQGFENVEGARSGFEAKFFERTNNKWEHRDAFKPFFGKWTFVSGGAFTGTDGGGAERRCGGGRGAGSSQAPASKDLEAEAHKLIDAAKAAQWADVYKVLESKRELVNVRPEVREYGILHQAAYYGRADVVARLVDGFGADASQRTRSGRTPAEVAEEHGHDALAATLAERAAARSAA